MAIISRRHRGYQAALLLFFCGLVVFVVGLATPYWYTVTPLTGENGSKVYGGLWYLCYYQRVDREPFCLDTVWESTRWIKEVKALESMALALMVICLLCAIYANFLARTISTTRNLELGLGLAGGLGLGGAIHFSLQLSEDKDKWMTENGDFVRVSLSWSFALAISGCALVILAGILHFIFIKQLQQQQQQQHYYLPTTLFSSLGDTALMGTPKPPPGTLNVYATPGVVAPPPPYFVDEVKGAGQGHAVQGQVLAPMVYDTPVGGQKQ